MSSAENNLLMTTKRVAHRVTCDSNEDASKSNTNCSQRQQRMQQQRQKVLPAVAVEDWQMGGNGRLQQA
jgi:hypothetical protein